MYPSVLVVGQNDARLAATRAALAAGGLTNPVVSCRDAVDAAAYMLGRPPFGDPVDHPQPAVVVTDLRLPRGTGLDILRLLRTHLTLRGTPVVVLADGASEEDILAAQDLGAAAFLSSTMACDVLLGVIRDTGVPWSVGRLPSSA
jgi:CheY-like chemotaxis protein